MELRCFCQQDARDPEMGEYHIRGSLERLVVGALESVALNRRAGHGAHLGHKVFDVFMGDVKRVVVQIKRRLLVDILPFAVEYDRDQ